MDSIVPTVILYVFATYQIFRAQSGFWMLTQQHFDKFESTPILAD